MGEMEGIQQQQEPVIQLLLEVYHHYASDPEKQLMVLGLMKLAIRQWYARAEQVVGIGVMLREDEERQRAIGDSAIGP